MEKPPVGANAPENNILPLTHALGPRSLPLRRLRAIPGNTDIGREDAGLVTSSTAREREIAVVFVRLAQHVTEQDAACQKRL